MGNLGWTEILIILVIALIVFGPRKLPELGKALGQSLAQFRRASEDFKRTWEQEVETEKRRLEVPPVARAPETPGTPYQTEDIPQTGQPPSGATGETAVASSPEEPAISAPTSEAVVSDTKRDWV